MDKVGFTWYNYLYEDIHGAEFWHTTTPSHEYPNLAVYVDKAQITYVYTSNFITASMRKVRVDGELRLQGLGDLTQDGRGNFWVCDSAGNRILWLQWNSATEALVYKKAFTGFSGPRSVSYTEPDGTLPFLMVSEPSALRLRQIEPFTGAVRKEKVKPMYHAIFDIATSWNPFWPGRADIVGSNAKIYISVPQEILEINPLTLEPGKSIYQRNPENSSALFPRYLEVSANGMIVGVDRWHSRVGLWSPDGVLAWESTDLNLQQLRIPALWQDKVILAEDITFRNQGWEMFMVQGFYHASPRVSNLQLSRHGLNPGDSLTFSFSVNGRSRVAIRLTNRLRSFQWKDTLLMDSGTVQLRYPAVLPIDGTWTLSIGARGTAPGNTVVDSFTVNQTFRMAWFPDTALNGVEVPGFHIYNYELTGVEKKALVGFSENKDAYPAVFSTRSSALNIIGALNILGGFAQTYGLRCALFSKNGDCAGQVDKALGYAPGYYAPSLREWLRAAGTVRYPLGTLAWFLDNSGKKSHTVGMLAANAYGLYDVLGNIPELTDNLQSNFTPIHFFQYGEPQIGNSVSYSFLGMRDPPTWSMIRVGGGYTSDSAKISRMGVESTPAEIHALSATNAYVDANSYLGLRPILRKTALDSLPKVQVQVATDTALAHKPLSFSLNQSQAGRVFVRLVSPLGHRLEVPGFQDLVWDGNGKIQEPKSWILVSSGRSAHSLLKIPDCPGMWKIEVARASSRPVWATDSFLVLENDSLWAELNSLRIRRYEVTQGDYQAVMGYNPSLYQGYDWNDDWNRPADRVSFHQALIYLNLRSWISGYTPAYQATCLELNSRAECQQLNAVPVLGASGFRLPDSAQWRSFYGADSITGLPWPRSQVGSRYAWYNLPATNPTQAVGMLQPNRFGLYDVAGNVYEWIWGGDSTSGFLKGGGKWSLEKYLKISYTQAAEKSAKNIYGFRFVQPVHAHAATYELHVKNGWGTGKYNPGDTVRIGALDMDTPFSYWAGDTNVFVATGVADQRILVMPNHSITIQAHYAPPTVYNLVVANGAGSGSYAGGTTVCIAATVPDEMVFVEWKGGIPGTITNLPNPCFTMPRQNLSLSAVLAIPNNAMPTYELQVVGGSGSGQYPIGSQVDIESIYTDGSFAYWSTDSAQDLRYIADTAASTTRIWVMKNLHIYAHTHTIPPLALNSLTVIQGTGSGKYQENAQVLVHPVSPGTEWTFSHWSNNGIAMSSDSTLVMPASSATITAIFVKSDFSGREDPGSVPISPILDFEYLTGWSSGGYAWNLSLDSYFGSHSFCGTIDHYGTITSIPLTSAVLGNMGDSLGIAVKLGANPPNPHWLGTIQLKVSFPSSAQQFDLGRYELTGRSLQEWLPLTFALPSAAKELLQHPHNDMQVEIILNGGGHQLCLDHLHGAGTYATQTVKPWPDACSGRGCLASDPIDLGGSNTNTVVSVSGVAWLQLSNLAFAWKPSTIQVQVRALDDAQLTGEWLYNGQYTALSGWSDAISIPYQGETALSLALLNYGQRQYEVRWWAQ